MSHSNQQNNSQYQPPSQNGFQYQPVHYPADVYHQGTQARDDINPEGHDPSINYPDPRISGYPQPSPLQSNMTHQVQQHNLPTQQDYNRQQSHQVQYISTPPLVAPGVFHNPNPPPFTMTPRTAVQNTSPPQVRFQCDKCGNTFSRAHDRNRHYETTHSDNPPIHKCERCRKQFSRADAKKRHQDDGKCMGSP